MSESKSSRRHFLRSVAMTAVGVMAASCAQPTAQVIEREVPVERVVKETVVVEKEVPVEKVVKETVVVEKQVPVEKVVTATPVPAKFREAPMLAEMVARGELPPVDQRLPPEPLVIDVVEEIGQYGGTWRRGYTGMADRWNAMKMEEGMLVRWRQPEGGNISLEPYVCEKFEQNADATAFTWYLRKGIRWSDGVPLTTEDVRWWYEMLLEGVVTDSRNWRPDDQTMVIEILDDFTFTTSFAAPNPIVPFWVASTERLTSGRGPNFGDPAHYMKQFHPKYAKKEELDQKLKEAGLADWKDFLKGTGPAVNMYTNPDRPVILAWKTKVPPPASRYVMERNPYFWQVDPAGNQLPYVDEIAMDLFESTEAFNFKIISGEIDCQGRHVNAANYTLFKEYEEQGGYRVLIWRDTNTHTYTVNTSYGIEDDPVMYGLLNDINFRRALSVAIDREEIAELVYSNLLTPRQSSPIPGTPEYDAEWETSYAQYDPALANKLLDELGLDKRGSDGFRLRPDGQTLTVILEFSDLAFCGALDQHEIVKENWEAVGIKTLTRVGTRELVAERAANNQLMFSVWGWGLAIGLGMHGVLVDPPSAPYANWYLRQGTEGIEPPKDHLTWKIWELFEQVKVEANEAKRTELWLQIRDIWKEQLWRIGVCGMGPALYITKNNFRNVPSGLIDNNTTRNIGLAMAQQFFFKKA